MKRSFKEMLVRVVILMIGLTIAHLGVTLFILSDLGNDPFNVFVQGVFRTLMGGFTEETVPPLNLGLLSIPLTHGNTHMAISFFIILVLLIVDRKYVKIGTLLCMFCGGPIIDVFTLLLKPLFEAMSSTVFNVSMLAAGCVILAYGMTIVIKSDAGTGPNDLVAVVISDKMKWKFSIVRIAVDACFVGIGLLLGGNALYGTVICAFLVGPVAGIFLPINEKLINGVVAKVK